jgi:hypothetical protein
MVKYWSMNSTPEEVWSDWFNETHNGTGEIEFDSDVDECVMPEPFDDIDLL